ncbi:MAG: T9SS type A sorting domain-containing protein [Parachlamydiaceae bacterium]|nr:T9SS type A sorting domain-containing protein [Parachlamydiaceae bacterium]
MMREKIKKYALGFVILILSFSLHPAIYSQDRNDGMASINASATDFAYPQSIYVDSKSGHIWITDLDNNRVMRFDVSTLTDIKNKNVNQNIPTSFSLAQNYPNPFNPSTVISYKLSENSYVTLKVYDLFGREVATLVNEIKQSGNYKLTFNSLHLERSREMPSGVYFYSLRAGNFTETKKMLMIK